MWADVELFNHEQQQLECFPAFISSDISISSDIFLWNRYFSEIDATTEKNKFYF